MKNRVYALEYGQGKYTYNLVDGWAKTPIDESLVDIVGLSVDEKDRIYAFGRSSKPLIVFDRDGNIVDSWGEGLFKRPHGSFMTKEGDIWLADDDSHVVLKFTRDGQLLQTIQSQGSD